MGEFSLSHIMILGLILLLFLGPSRLPGVAKGLGEAIRDFKKALSGDDDKPAERHFSKNEAIAENNPEREKQKPS